jgi:hypothetical protein
VDRHVWARRAALSRVAEAGIGHFILVMLQICVHAWDVDAPPGIGPVLQRTQRDPPGRAGASFATTISLVASRRTCTA